MKRALITGATSGIGYALAEKLARKGVSLILSGQRRDVLAPFLSQWEEQIPIEIVIADLADAEDRKRLIEVIRQQTPDAVFNCAGIGQYGPAISIPIERQIALLRLNIEAVLALTIESIQSMKAAQEKGVIVNVASAAAFFPFPDFAVYGASKVFVQHFSEALDVECEPYGIRVLCSCPGMVKTGFQERSGSLHGLNEKNPMVMDVSFAAEQILWQVEKGRAVYAFHWPYRLFRCLLPFFPRRWMMRRMQKSIRHRI